MTFDFTLDSVGRRAGRGTLGNAPAPTRSQSVQCVWRKCTPLPLQSQFNARIPSVSGGLSELLFSGLCKNYRLDEHSPLGILSPLASRATALVARLKG
jgi:hypothetical protein